MAPGRSKRHTGLQKERSKALSEPVASLPTSGTQTDPLFDLNLANFRSLWWTILYVRTYLCASIADQILCRCQRRPCRLIRSDKNNCKLLIYFSPEAQRTQVRKARAKYALVEPEIIKSRSLQPVSLSVSSQLQSRSSSSSSSLSLACLMNPGLRSRRRKWNTIGESHSRVHSPCCRLVARKSFLYETKLHQC